MWAVRRHMAVAGAAVCVDEAMRAACRVGGAVFAVNSQWGAVVGVCCSRTAVCVRGNHCNMSALGVVAVVSVICGDAAVVSVRVGAVRGEGCRGVEVVSRRVVSVCVAVCMGYKVSLGCKCDLVGSDLWGSVSGCCWRGVWGGVVCRSLRRCAAGSYGVPAKPRR